MALVKKYYYCHVALVYGNDSCGTEHTVPLLRGAGVCSSSGYSNRTRLSLHGVETHPSYFTFLRAPSQEGIQKCFL